VTQVLHGVIASLCWRKTAAALRSYYRRNATSASRCCQPAPVWQAMNQTADLLLSYPAVCGNMVGHEQ